jgi:beta-galactosidase
VRAFGRCDEIEVLLAGKSLGRQRVPVNSHVRWKVPYRPGTLAARCLVNGETVAEDSEETAGAAAAVTLSTERPALAADGEDMAAVTVSVVDAAGRRVPDAAQEVRFALGGPGRIIGVGNGDPGSHEADRFTSGTWKRRVFHGLAQVLVQSRRGEPGALTLEATADGLRPARLTLSTAVGTLRPVVEPADPPASR